MALTAAELTEQVLGLAKIQAAFEERVTYCHGRLTEVVGNHKSVNDSCQRHDVLLEGIARDIQELSCYKQHSVRLAEITKDIEELKRWMAESKEAAKDKMRWLRSFWPPVLVVFISIFGSPIGTFFWNFIKSLGHSNASP